MPVKEKELKAGQEMVKIYYFKGFTSGIKAPENPNMENYELVCNYPIQRSSNDTDEFILEVMFELFNWVNEEIQPDNKELGFYKPESVFHTSMSVGDIVEINNEKYICDSIGWKKLRA